MSNEQKIMDDCVDMVTEILKLREENRRLRAALEAILDNHYEAPAIAADALQKRIEEDFWEREFQ